MHVFNAVVRSGVEYDCESMAFNKSQMTALQLICTTAGKTILQAPRRSPTAAVQADLGMACIVDRLDQAKLRFAARVQVMQKPRLVKAVWETVQQQWVDGIRRGSSVRKELESVIESLKLSEEFSKVQSGKDVVSWSQSVDTALWIRAEQRFQEQLQGSKLQVYRRVMSSWPTLHRPASYLRLGTPVGHRQSLTRSATRLRFLLRCGSLPLRVETGRWIGLPSADRLCQHCEDQLLEDERHFLLGCAAWGVQRCDLFALLNEKLEGRFPDRRLTNFLTINSDSLFALMLGAPCWYSKHNNKGEMMVRLPGITSKRDAHFIDQLV